MEDTVGLRSGRKCYWFLEGDFCSYEAALCQNISHEAEVILSSDVAEQRRHEPPFPTFRHLRLTSSFLSSSFNNSFY